MLERAASLIATDRVVVAEFGGTERWPGSGFILGSGSDFFSLFWSDRLHIHRDIDRAQQWLREMQELNARALKQKEKKLSKDDELAVRENRRHIASLRSLISSNADVPQYVNLSDHDFLQLVINFLKDGDLLPIYHRYPGIADPGPDKPPDGPPPPVKPSGGKDDPDDPNDDPPVPGQCLLRAAESGSPFMTIPDGDD